MTTPPDPTMTVWLGTEALDLSPVLCTGGEAGTRFVEELDRARIVQVAALVPCCRCEPNPGAACARDTFDDMTDATGLRVLREAAGRAGIVWPADVTEVEP